MHRVTAVWYSTLYDYRDHVPKLKHAKLKEKHADFDISMHSVFIRDNVKISFFDKDYSTQDDHMFDVTFHTAFVDSNYLCFEKAVLDRACKDKGSNFDTAFVLELFLLPVTEDSKWASEDGYNSMYSSHVDAAVAERDRIFRSRFEKGSRKDSDIAADPAAPKRSHRVSTAASSEASAGLDAEFVIPAPPQHLPEQAALPAHLRRRSIEGPMPAVPRRVISSY
jgi:hypothetical protein